ncbi:unnamed protein product [Brachionus calyciflorus]|uniref:Uncharacterized protein n=1 Tax=Brachionus calyciflorus TaxID=104777 RepID=A0A814GMA0_9BILA|nr:unnamed protein product [Brachionus calyciflorus]
MTNKRSQFKSTTVTTSISITRTISTSEPEKSISIKRTISIKKKLTWEKQIENNKDFTLKLERVLIIYFKNESDEESQFLFLDWECSNEIVYTNLNFE